MPMKHKHWIQWLVLVAVILQKSTTIRGQQIEVDSDTDYAYVDADTEDKLNLDEEVQQRLKKYLLSGGPLTSAMLPAQEFNDVEEAADATTECIPAGGSAATTAPPATSAAETTTAAGAAPAAGATEGAAASSGGTGQDIDQEAKSRELHILVQHLYIAQARVQLEAGEIRKAQSVANSAQQALEEAANHVRAVTAALQTAQQEVAAAAIRAQTAQLQLAAHDQLLFAARQDVDALSSQMVGLQAAEGVAQPKINFDIKGLLDRLKQPLPDSEKPTAVPPIVPPPVSPKVRQREAGLEDFYYE